VGQSAILTTGLWGASRVIAVDTNKFRLDKAREFPAEKMGTRSFTFAQMDEAYDVFSNAAENSALKVVITPA